MDKTFAASVSGLLLVWAGVAYGQDAPPAPTDSPPPLQGPAVKQTRPPHTEDDFGEGMKMGKEGRVGPVIPMRSYAEVIKKLRGDKAPEGLRLSDDQEHKIGAIEQEFREAAQEFAQKMRQERAAQGSPPAQDASADKPERPRREMAQEIMKNGPKPGDYQTRIWATLSEKQQAFAKVELDKVREDLQKKRGEAMMARRLEQRRGDKTAQPDQAKTADARSADLTPARERAQRIMRRMAQLPPEDRDRILKRLEDELDRHGIPDDPAPRPKD